MKQSNSLMASVYSPFFKTKRIVVRSFKRISMVGAFVTSMLPGYSQVNGNDENPEYAANGTILTNDLNGIVEGIGATYTDIGLYGTFRNLTIYPNPAKDIITIDLPIDWQKKHLKFEIFNVNGQILNDLQTTIYKENVRLDLSKLPKGFYFIKLCCEGQTGIQKIIIQ